MIDLRVNGRDHIVDADPDSKLLYVLRNDLGLKGTRFGCGVGACGACTVLVDGRPMRSCEVPLAAVQGTEVLTVEGISDGDAHPLQRAFLAEQAAQCGYCISGILMSAKALLDVSPRPNDDEIRRALDENLCRCGSHARVLRAIRRAAEMMAG